MDKVLHAERLDGRQKRLSPLPAPIEQLPDGTMVAADGISYLLLGGRALGWTPAGYRNASELLADSVRLLTPPSIVRALAAGFRPVFHLTTYLPDFIVTS